MDRENNEVLPASDPPMPQAAIVETEAVAKPETPEESKGPEKPPAAEEAGDQPAVNGEGTQVQDPKDAEKAAPESAPSVATPQESEDSSEGLPELIEVSSESARQQPEPESVAESTPEPEKLLKPAETEAAGQEEKTVEAAKEPAAAEGAAAAAGPGGAVEEEKPAEAAAEATSEPGDAELPKEEDSGPAPGSLTFALLENEQTKDALRSSRTMVILRGLPGSGKSFLASAIADTYTDHCSIFCGDTYGIKPESIKSCTNELTALDEALVARCKEATPLLIVVDDTNHLHNRLAHLGELAEQNRLVTIFLEPQTEWSKDPAQLCKKTKRGLEPAALETMKATFLEVSLPLFFGWFLLSASQDKVNCMAQDFMKTLDTLEAFRLHLADFAEKDEALVDLEHYFKVKGALHCTTKFCDYGKAEGAKEYANNPAVKEFYSSVTELSLSALFVTPRTAGARVALTEGQLLLWPADAEKQAESTVPGAASLPLGSRAHVTLGCADGVEPVQTGLDLLDILVLLQSGQQGETVAEMELGTLTYHGAGRWMLSFREPIVAPACFSSYYGRKETDAAKPEKKKKPKCAIL